MVKTPARDFYGLRLKDKGECWMPRPETGAMRFEGDWRGVFIRGDNAFGYAMNIKEMLSERDTEMAKKIGRASLEGLLALLLSSDERNEGVETQQMKPFEECMTRK